MRVTRKHIPARHDWLDLTDEKGAIGISMMAHRTEIVCQISIDGQEDEAWLTPRELAVAVMQAIQKKNQQ